MAYATRVYPLRAYSSDARGPSGGGGGASDARRRRAKRVRAHAIARRPLCAQGGDAGRQRQRARKRRENARKRARARAGAHCVAFVASDVHYNQKCRRRR